MHHDRIMESYIQLTPLNNYLSNCVIKLLIKLQLHVTKIMSTLALHIQKAKQRLLCDFLLANDFTSKVLS